MPDPNDIFKTAAGKKGKKFVLSRDLPICVAIGCCVVAAFVLFKLDNVKTAIVTLAILIIAVNCCLEFYKEPSKPAWKTFLGILHAIKIIEAAR